MYQAYEYFEQEFIKIYIEQAAGYYFFSMHKYIVAKNRYLTALKSGHSSKLHLLKLKEELRTALYYRIRRSRIYKMILQ